MTMAGYRATLSCLCLVTAVLVPALTLGLSGQRRDSFANVLMSAERDASQRYSQTVIKFDRRNASQNDSQTGNRSVKAMTLTPQRLDKGHNGTTAEGTGTRPTVHPGKSYSESIGTRLEHAEYTDNNTIPSTRKCPQNCTCTFSLAPEASLVITCSNNKSSEFETELSLLLSLVPLTTLIITHSPLQNLSKVGICILTSLLTLNLGSNKLADIPPGCFAGMSNLTTLNLEANKIQELHDGLFEGLSNIKSIDLDHNWIRHIDPKVFTNYTMLRNIQSIQLCFNKLSSIDIWPIYLAVHNEDRNHADLNIGLRGNSINSTSNHLGWTYTPSMPPSGAAETSINLYDNLFTHITPIFLGWNITVVKAIGLFFPNKIHISFINCPMNCDCKDFKYYKLMFVTMLTPMVNDLKCANPIELRGDALMRLKLDQFVCDLVHDCPHDCKCIQRPSNRTLHIRCQGAQMEALPRIIPKKPDNYSIKLEFENNNITKINSQRYFQVTTIGDFSNNQIQRITMEALNHFQYWSKIYLQHNQISKLPEEIKDMNFTRVKELGLYHNPFSCRCEDRWMKAWLRGLYHDGKLIQSEGILCDTPARLKGSNILELDEKEFCRDPQKEAVVKTVIIAVSSIMGVTVLLFAPLMIVYHLRVWIYRKFRWHPFNNDECDGEDKEFDAFISYANEDEGWVINLVEKLEAEDFKLLFHKRDFLGGLPITENVGLAVEKYKRVVCVVSESYLKSNMCMWEFTATVNVDLDEKKHRTIVIKYESLSEVDMNATMRAYLRSHTYIDCYSDHFMENLLYSLPQHHLQPAPVSSEFSQELDLEQDSDPEFPDQSSLIPEATVPL